MKAACPKLQAMTKLDVVWMLHASRLKIRQKEELMAEFGV